MEDSDVAEHHESDGKMWVIMVVTVAFTLVACMIIVRLAPVGIGLDPWQPQSAPETLGPRPVQETGVNTSISVGDEHVEVVWRDLDVTVGADQSLHEDLPAGPFLARFDVRFEVRDRRQARIGAEHYGGLLLISRGDEVLVSDYGAPPEEPDGKALVSLSDVQTFAAGVHTIEYRFERTEAVPARLRAVWQPTSAREPEGLF